MTVTKSSQNNLTSPNGNSLAVFVDIADSTLKLKDINGNVEDFTIYLPPTPLGDGILQLQNGAPLDSTLRSVTDQKNTASPLKLSTDSAQFVSPLRISTDDASEMYLDCEDGSQNNRFNITRNTASQQVNLNFASNPVGGTTTVGAIRTYVDGTNLSEVMEFREDGNVKVGGILSVGNYANSTGFGQKIRIIGQGDASLGIYRNQASASAAKLEFMKSRGTYDSPLIVNANDLIGNVGYFGYNGTSYSNSASISSAALSTSATGVEGDVRFILYNNTGSNFNPMRITKEGVGIGNALNYIPSAILQVRGNGSTSATTSLLVQNSASFQLLKVTDDGQCQIGSNGATTFPLQVYGNSGLQIQVGNTFFSYEAVRTIRFLNPNNGIPLNHEVVNQVSLTDNSNYVYFRNQTIQTAGSLAPFIGISIETPVNTQTDALVTQLNIAPIFNLQANTTSGSIQRGIYYNPTITDLRTAKHYGIQTTSGGAYINTATPQASACLQADSTTQGFLPPRMTTAEKVTLAATAVAGLMIYDTNLNKLCVYTGAGWETITSV
jgi:hypothetical protein